MKTVLVRAVVVLGITVSASFPFLVDQEPVELLTCRERGVHGLVSLCDLFSTNRVFLTEGAPVPRRRAIALAKHPLYLPESLPGALARERPEFWAVDRQVGVRYRSGSESGLVVTYSLWPPGAEPSEHYVEKARQWKPGEAITIQGWPAYVSSDGGGLSGISVVTVTIDRTEVGLFGRVELDILIEIAESLSRLA
jgi:hypothetical protein